jgi:ABC-type sugar transport system ATPase subunit
MLPNLSIADSMFMGRELRKPEGQRRPFGSKVFILNEPTAALGVKGSRKVLELLQI